MPTLTIDHDGRRREVTLDAPVFTIGRDAACSLVVEHASVSRTHCQLVRRGNAYDVEDLGSQAGTRLDGQRVTRAPIKPGQTLHVGPARILYSAASSQDLDATIPMGVDVPPPPGWALYGIEGPRTGVAVCFAGRISIGRAAGCDLVLDGGEVSTQHCELLPESGHVALVDVGSTNGTRVGDRMVRDAKLLGGEVLAIGPHVFVVERHPLPPSAQRSMLGARAAELALVAAIALLLWGLAARIVVRPLLVARTAAADPRAVPFSALGPDRLPLHYAFQHKKEWELSVLRVEGLLKLVGTGTADQELMAVLARGLPATEGWRTRGMAEAVRGSLEVSLIGVYRDAAGAIVATHYSQVLTLAEGQRQDVMMALPPVEGASWVQPGYVVRGRVREARLGPLSPEPASQPPFAHGRVRVAGIEAALTPGGVVELTGIAHAELAVLEEGVIVTSPRSLVAAAPRPIAGGFALVSEQVDEGARAPFELALAARDGGVAAKLTGGHATHLSWTWTVDPVLVDLYYQGSPREPAETRPLADEIAIARADGSEFTIRVAPPVYLEGRWRDAAGRERWQLRFAERTDVLVVECHPGNRQRERELVRARLQFAREHAAGNLPEALRVLARWRALESGRGGPELAVAERQIDELTSTLVAGAIADVGPDGWARLVTLLAAYRGTAHEEALEAEVARRVVAMADEPSRVQRARWLLSQGRYMAAYGYFALARATLTWLVQLEPASPEGAEARDLLRILPAQ